jgi:hypothetical protein
VTEAPDPLLATKDAAPQSPEDALEHDAPLDNETDGVEELGRKTSAEAEDPNTDALLNATAHGLAPKPEVDAEAAELPHDGLLPLAVGKNKLADEEADGPLQAAPPNEAPLNGFGNVLLLLLVLKVVV